MARSIVLAHRISLSDRGARAKVSYLFMKGTNPVHDQGPNHHLATIRTASRVANTAAHNGFTLTLLQSLGTIGQKIVRLFVF